MDFIDDREKMNDMFNLTKYEFLNSYSYLTKEDYQATLDKLWESLGDIPIDNKEKIDTDFYKWKKGTPRKEIWYWFDARVTNGIGNRYFN